jgi:hypothetical protein
MEENGLHEKMLEFFTGLKRHKRKIKQLAIKLPMKVRVLILWNCIVFASCSMVIMMLSIEWY